MPRIAIKRLEREYQNLHELIPPMVNNCGQSETAKRLGISSSTVNTWLKANGYKLKRQYVREVQEGGAAR